MKIAQIKFSVDVTIFKFLLVLTVSHQVPKILEQNQMDYLQQRVMFQNLFLIFQVLQATQISHLFQIKMLNFTFKNLQNDLKQILSKYLVKSQMKDYIYLSKCFSLIHFYVQQLSNVQLVHTLTKLDNFQKLNHQQTQYIFQQRKKLN